MLFRMFKTRQPTAGAEAYAFQSGQLDPVFSLMGPGTEVNPPWRATQPSQSYYPYKHGPIAGVGGLIFDTNYFQPLMSSTRR